MESVLSTLKSLIPALPAASPAGAVTATGKAAGAVPAKAITPSVALATPVSVTALPAARRAGSGRGKGGGSFFFVLAVVGASGLAVHLVGYDKAKALVHKVRASTHLCFTAGSCKRVV